MKKKKHTAQTSWEIEIERERKNKKSQFKIQFQRQSSNNSNNDDDDNDDAEDTYNIYLEKRAIFVEKRHEMLVVLGF